MIKLLKYSLIILPIVLSIILVVNIYKYNNTSNNNQEIVQNTNNYQNKFEQNTKQKEELLTKINNLKEKKKDKLWEYERWIKWNQEIVSKIN